MAFTWKAIGVEPWGTDTFYLVESFGRVLRIRQAHIVSSHQLLAIDPDADQWRKLFPHPHRMAKFDALAAGAMVMRECIAAQQRRDAAKSAAE